MKYINFHIFNIWCTVLFYAFYLSVIDGVVNIISKKIKNYFVYIQFVIKMYSIENTGLEILMVSVCWTHVYCILVM